MLISPILNAYIEKYEKRTVLYLAVVFVALEMWFDCILNNNRFGFTQGYSVLHFCVIYVLGRLIALYKDRLLGYIKYWKWILLFCGCCIFISLMHVLDLPFTFNYSNPVVILSAICSFMPFLYFEFTNKAINWIASGSFAVYIVQIVDPIFLLLCDLDKSLLSNNPYILYLAKGLIFCVLFFLLCVIYDKLREFLSRGIVKRINNIYERYF